MISGMTMLAQHIRPLSQVLDEMPEGEKWEIIDGGLYCQAAAGFDHNETRDGLLTTLKPPYRHGVGGPGGWWIVAEQRFVGPNPDRFTLSCFGENPQKKSAIGVGRHQNSAFSHGSFRTAAPPNSKRSAPRR